MGEHPNITKGVVNFLVHSHIMSVISKEVKLMAFNDFEKSPM